MAIDTAAIDAAIRQAVADPYTGLPRAIAIASTRDDEVYRGLGGWAQLPQDPAKLEEEGVPIEADSVFELYSSTKLAGTVAMLQLLEQGKLSLDDDASQYVPELKTVKIFKGFDDQGELVLEDNDVPITIRQLATHTAGFAYYFYDPRIPKVAEKLGVQTTPYMKDGTRNDLVQMPLLSKPGEHFKYGTGIDWLTLVVEAISSLPLEQYFQQHIFGPLGITDISFKANPSQISIAHATEDGKWRFEAPPAMNEKAGFGGAGLKGSAPSWVRLLRALLRGGELDGARILKQETVDLMFEEHLTNDQQRADFGVFGTNDQEPFTRKAGKPLPDMTFGLGGGLSGKGVASGRGARTLTWSGMANTYWWVDRERGVCAVVWTNVLPFGAQAIHDLWVVFETELYKGLPA
ncbi:hypothetical protein JCM8208_003124 [Rhodotorula glutinis]